MCMMDGEGACKSLLKSSLCQKTETCADTLSLSQAHALFAKVIHHHLKQLELSPSSRPPHIQIGPWGSLYHKISWQFFFHLGAHLGLLKKLILKEMTSQGISIWNSCSLGPIALPSEILSRKAGQGQKKAHIVGKYPGMLWMEGRWGLLCLGPP